MKFQSVNVALVVTILSPFIESQIFKSSYGEPCNSTLRCDKGAWLSCQNSSCNCMFPENMQYNAEVTKCQALSGERCKFQVNNITGVESLIFYETSDCVPNADCNANGICECGIETSENIEGSCSPRKTAGEPCDSDLECNLEAQLSCIDASCACISTLVLHSGRCYARAGYPANEFQCVPGSTRDLNGKCICDQEDGEKFAKDGRCYDTVSYLEKCELDHHCKSSSFLSCVEGSCSCDTERYKFGKVVYTNRTVVEETCVEVYEQHLERTNQAACFNFPNQVGCLNSTYCIPPSFLCDGYKDCKGGSDENEFLCSFCRDGVGQRSMEVETKEEREECVGLANKACNANLNCVENAECKNGICVCSNDYTKYSDGSCAKSFGSTCTPHSKCSDSFACLGGNCRCPASEHQIYDTGVNAEKCLSLIHGPCVEHSDCVANAQCQSITYGHFMQCKCKLGFIENSEGKCDLAYGMPCAYDASTGHCDRIGKLECRDGKCGCVDNLTIFDAANRQCLGLVDSRCNDIGRNGAKTCVRNASCKNKIKELGGVCKCIGDYKPTEDRMCIE